MIVINLTFVRNNIKDGGKVFADKIKNLRIKGGVSQKDLAAALNTSRSNISKYENGQLEPNIEMLKKLCAFYGVSADYLLGLAEESKE